MSWRRSGYPAAVRLDDLEEGVREGGGLVRRADVVLDEGGGDLPGEVGPVDWLSPEVDSRGVRDGQVVQAADEIGDLLSLLFGDDAIGEGVLHYDAVQCFLDPVQAGATAVSFGLLGFDVFE